MATFHSIAGGLGGFKHRLSKIYQDTKNLYDFIEPPRVSGAPELTSLHRKLRIQKDRLIAWGLQWSDHKSGEKGQPADIDESLDKAGLGDVVGSVLATIKEIIAEADPLWQSSRALMVTGGGDEKVSVEEWLVRKSVGGEKAAERRPSFVQWDRARFEGLVHDLTVSIDTLYDISRNRQRPSKWRPGDDLKDRIADESEAAASTSMSRENILAPKEPQFESSRIQTPQQIDPLLLIHLEDIEGTLLQIVPLKTQPVEGTRQIVYMRRQHTSNNPWKRDGGVPLVPVLLEYAAFDDVFAITGIGPSMDKFEKLFAGLQNPSHPDFRVLNLIGYFEHEEPTFGLIYELPKEFGPIEALSYDENSCLPMIFTLSHLLKLNAFCPAPESKFRMAYRLATTVFKLLAKNVTHGNVASDNVIFFHQKKPHPNFSTADCDIRQPFLTNFDLFSPLEGNGDSSSYSELVEFGNSSHAGAKENDRAMDLKGLALLLLETGLWTPLEEIVKLKSGTSNDKARLKEADFLGTSEICARLAAQCGTLYLKAVQFCWQAGILEASRSSQRDPDLRVKLQWKVIKALEECCAIDEGSEAEEFDSVVSPPQAAILSRTSAGSEKREYLNPAQLVSSTQPADRVVSSLPTWRGHRAPRMFFAIGRQQFWRLWSSSLGESESNITRKFDAAIPNRFANHSRGQSHRFGRHPEFQII